MYKTHRTEGSVVPVAVRHVSPHANAGGSEQLAAANESRNGELRAAKYGTEGSETYCALTQ